MTLPGIKNREPSLKYLFSWNNQVHMEQPGGSGHRDSDK